VSRSTAKSLLRRRGSLRPCRNPAWKNNLQTANEQQVVQQVHEEWKSYTISVQHRDISLYIVRRLVHTTTTEVQLGRTSSEPDHDLEGEPSSTGGLNDEEWVGEVGRLITLAVRHCKVRQCLHAE